MDEPDDASAIRQSIEDPDRFHVIFDRYATEIYRYAARRLPPDAAEDVVAETFLAAFRRRESYVAQRADARAWLYGIAAAKPAASEFRYEVDTCVQERCGLGRCHTECSRNVSFIARNCTWAGGDRVDGTWRTGEPGRRLRAIKGSNSFWIWRLNDPADASA